MNPRSLARLTVRLAPLAALLLAFTTGARECDDGTPPAGSCEVDGVVYDDGATNVPAGDGCNTCSCQGGALTGCTEIACVPGGSCVVDGVTYADGATGIPAPDGCNSCACSGGALSCTERACPPMDGACVVDGVRYAHGATDVPAPDGCNTCSCDNGAVTGCTEIGCTPPPGACSVYGVSYTDGWAPAADGCNTCRCDADGQVTNECTEQACAAPPIEACTAWSSPFVSDPFELEGARVDGDLLNLDVAYSGGCAPHFFRVCYMEAFLESNPVQVEVRVEHDGQMDPCEAYPMETRSFDLRPLAQAYREMYRVEHDRLIIRLGDGLPYSF